MAGTPTRVDRLLADLEHPRSDEVERLRATILAAEPGITETVKWNAPSFRYGDEDRITFRLAPRGILQLIFHRGARVRADTAGFVFEDPSGLLRWPAPDRGVLDFPATERVDVRLDVVADLVRRWIRA